jgi:predicted MPP superfamily phosphohydrolase
MLYPAGNIIDKRSHPFLSLAFENISGYLLPFCLYLFLFILLFDIFLLVNLIFKIIPGDLLKTTRSKRNILATILVMSGIVVTGGIINFNIIRISGYTIDLPAKSSRMQHLKIAFVSDFHLRENTSIAFVKRFEKKMNEIKPDLILYGGDMTESRSWQNETTEYEKILNGLSSKFQTFAVLGNHEHYSGNDKGNLFEKTGIRLLRDTVIVINDSFSLAGRNDSGFSHRKTAEELLKDAPDTLPVILFDHRPSEIASVSNTKADIQFSGHTHDGQLFPVSLITKRVYILSYGYRKIANTHFFVTSGIRLWGPPVRTAGKSEIVVVNVKFSRL